MERLQVLAFRYARSGLAARTDDLAAAAACPLSDFARDAALHALAARADGVTRERVVAAVDGGELALAHTLRGAIHLQAAAALPVFGRALVGGDDKEVRAQTGFEAADLATVTAAVTAALGDSPLDKQALHAGLRERLPDALLPWCAGCGSHHAPPGLWRYATIRAGARLDAQRRYVLDDAGDADPAEAVRRFLRWYAPAASADFAGWAGMLPRQARALWDAAGVQDGVLPEDADALANPPEPRGVRLLPPGDPFLQKPNRTQLVPDAEARRRFFRPAASPGLVLVDGEVIGTWRTKAGQVLVEAPRVPGVDEEVERLQTLARR